MSSSNTFAGFYSLPAVTATSTSAFTYKVPAAAGTYPTLPSPSQIAGNALVLSVAPGDITTGSSTVDYGRPFRVRVSGAVNSGQSENITVALYQCTGAVASAGFTAATGTGQTAIATTGAMATGAALKFNFFLDAVCQWDSVSKTLNSYYYGLASKGTPAIIGPTIQTAAVTTAAEGDLNFYFVLTASVNTVADVFGPLDFYVDRF
jgi:hypothetical protein